MAVRVKWGSKIAFLLFNLHLVVIYFSSSSFSFKVVYIYYTASTCVYNPVEKKARNKPPHGFVEVYKMREGAIRVREAQYRFCRGKCYDVNKIFSYHLL